VRIVATRGGRFESEHPIAAVLVGPDGAVHDRVGDPVVTTWRSAAKPFQLEVSLGLLPTEQQAALSEQDVAVGASSHHGEAGHVRQVRGVLERFGCTEEDLFCGTHWPGDVATTHAMLRAHQEASAIHNNCSGKHSFMAAACKVHGWPRDYRDKQHPLMERIRANIRRRTGDRLVDEVIDGCGVPCYTLPIDGMAQAWAQLAAAFAGETPAATGGSLLGRIGRAMQANPWHASGTGAIDGHLMKVAAQPVVAKVGAEGLLCVAVPGEQRAFAVKALTGSGPARAVAVHALLDRWFPGLIPAESVEAYATVTNWVGTRVGRLEVR
jgi:L-asparaginase II